MLRIFLLLPRYLNCFILFLGAIMFSSCTVMYVPKFENSNQMFLEQTIDRMNFGLTLKKVIPVGSRVALVSMELNTTDGQPLFAVIEDQLIQSLSNAGLVPLERDEHLLGRLVAENNSDVYTVIHLPLRDSVNVKMRCTPFFNHF